MTVHRCYLCGDEVKWGLNRTKEHIPPKGFFPKDTPQFTIPCCNSCQDEYKELDEEMRNKFAFSSEHSPQEVRDKAYRALQMGRAKFEKMEITDALDSQGRQRLRINFGSNYQKWLARIIRGMHFLTYGERLEPKRIQQLIHIPMDEINLPDELLATLDTPRLKCFYCDLLPDELVPAFGEPGDSVWMTVFYQKLFFITVVRS